MTETERPHPAVKLHCRQETRTKQSFKDAADINIIMAGIIKGKTNDYVNPAEPHYGDFSNAQDYLTSVLQLKEAEASFDALPVKIRSRFNYDPAELMEFVDNPDNLEEGRQLGLFEPAPPPPLGGENARPPWATKSDPNAQPSGESKEGGRKASPKEGGAPPPDKTGG